MTRIIGGVARGRRLRVPAAGTRPTSDRAREAVFSSLESLRGGWSGACVLDLYAGSGALGLEALSRGAGHVDLVESDPGAARVVTSNAESLGTVGGSAVVHRTDVRRWVSSPPRGGSRYDVVFCDPPYDDAEQTVAEVLSALLRAGALADDAIVVVERAERDQWTWPTGFTSIRDKRYGEARIWLGEVSSTD